jgi:hypothetical protein
MKGSSQHFNGVTRKPTSSYENRVPLRYFFLKYHQIPKSTRLKKNNNVSIELQYLLLGVKVMNFLKKGKKGKMKNWLVKTAVLALPVLVIFPGISNAADLTQSAAFWNYNGFSNTKIGVMPWYEDPSVSSFGYTTTLSNARGAWDGVVGASIGYSKQLTADAAYLRFFAVDDPNLNYYGIFKPYNSSGVLITDVDNTGNTLYKANLVMAHYQIQHSGLGRALTTAEKLDVAIHEIGHSLALRHQSDTSVSVMEETDITTYGAPTTLDKNNVTWKY